MAPLLMALWLAAASPTPFPHGTVALVSDATAVPAGGAVTLGLSFQLEPGWHIYWRNPGDSGEPPRVTWRLPAGWSVDALQWPRPQRLGSPTIVDYGYENAVLLLASAHAAGAASGDAPLAADLNILICRNECIPAKAHVSLEMRLLPRGTPAPPSPAAAARQFAAARAALPRPLPAAWNVTASEDAKSFTLTIHAPRSLSGLQVFPLSETQIDNAATPQLTPTPNGARVRLGRSTEDLQPSTRLAGLLALSGGETYAFDAPVAPARKR